MSFGSDESRSSASSIGAPPGHKRVLLVGSPNVGKSLLFNNLTGAYAVVSNYPGTTVEVTRGTWRDGATEWEVVDTPGMYSLLPTSEEERVSRRVIFSTPADAVVHVVDARNLERMLPLTLQLIEAGLPLVLALNIMDEARGLGIEIDPAALSRRLGIPVAGVVSTTGEGVEELRREIREARSGAAATPVKYSKAVEAGAQRIAALLPELLRRSARAAALLILQGDRDTLEMAGGDSTLLTIAEECGRRHAQPLRYVVAVRRQHVASEIAVGVMTFHARRRPESFAERLNRVLIHPVTGFIVLLVVLYVGLYQFVGVLGAGVLVDWLDQHLFQNWLNPLVEQAAQRLLPWAALHDLVAGEYGLLTLGLRYAVAIILPIVTLFFLVFAVMEDTGYLPRLALMLDRVFKRIGMSGRGVIPMVLGLGCDTMAVLVTRTLPTRRERIIGTLLLTLAVPCSAQLGLILALLHDRPAGLLIWALVVVGVFLAVGFLTARLMPGEPPRFYMELPPLRVPALRNVLIKTYTRVAWYLREVIPLFLLASVLIWLGRLSWFGGPSPFDLAIRALRHPVAWIGLPADAATILLFGFFRRDYGAAGLYDMAQRGELSGVQVTVAAVALTLFLPCIAQFLINCKERGWKVGVGISVFVLLFSFAVAFVVNALLHWTGATL